MTDRIPDNSKDIAELVLCLLDETISEDEYKHLEELLMHDEDAQDYYLELMEVCTKMRPRGQSIEMRGSNTTEEADSENIILEYINSDILEIEKKSLKKKLVNQNEIKEVSFKRSRLSANAVYKIIGAIAALILYGLILTFVQQYSSDIANSPSETKQAIHKALHAKASQPSVLSH